MVLLFFVLPLIYAILRPPLHIFGVLWTVAGFCAISLLLDRRFDRTRLWGSEGFVARMKPVLARFVPVALVTVASVWAFLPEQLFVLPRTRPGLWALIVVAYPWVSVYPQGLVYRAFVFHRYQPLFGSGWPMVIASGLLFAFSHVVFRNWPAVALTLIGGVLFARTYRRTRSLLVCFVEHALYGLLMFTVGLGRYLYL
jgi:membrane protease YdiL (CAAX protease family)